jgi:5-methyltetrahydrofolate--homocysteine methyltransferase
MAIRDIYEAVLAFDVNGVRRKINAELNAGSAADAILKTGLIAAMDEVGKRFSTGALFIPDMIWAAKAMQTGVEALKPFLTEGLIQSAGTVVIGTVHGDLHDIGKNLVKLMLEGARFNVIDLGVDITAERFAASAKENAADLVAMSALLTTTMPCMQQTVSAIRNMGLKAKTIVGGAPVTQTFADEIQADGYAEDATSAVELVRRLMK